MLPDVLVPDLALVVCGTAASTRSAERMAYYAGPGNKFWRTLEATGLTPQRLEPEDFPTLPRYGIGLTDVTKGQSGMDHEIDFKRSDPSAVRDKILEYTPAWLAFNGKRAAQIYLGTKTVDYGPLDETLGTTRLFVAPSTSGAANGSWDPTLWQALADAVRA